jgi:glycosyltransferase involved in cell wall biosynthesis
VRLSVNGQNLGLIGNLNMCLNSADADYYCILCADDYLNDSRAASDALDALESDATLAAVYSDLLYVDAKRHLLFQRSFNRRGSFDVKRTVMPCVLHTRNMFGIPVLVRREMMAGILYDPQLAYAGDADVAFQLGNRGGAYHIDRPLIANRYHGGNSSRSLHWQAYAEYRKIITKHGLQLSPWDEVAMRMLSFKTLAAKTFFFWLLDLKVARIRK